MQFPTYRPQAAAFITIILAAINSQANESSDAPAAVQVPQGHDRPLPPLPADLNPAQPDLGQQNKNPKNQHLVIPPPPVVQNQPPAQQPGNVQVKQVQPLPVPAPPAQQNQAPATPLATPAMLQDPLPLVGRNNDTPKAYSVALVPPFNPNQLKKVHYLGELRFEDGGSVRLSSLGTLDGKPVGNLIGGGANSKVFTSSDQSMVKKFVSLSQPGRSYNGVGRTITDQRGGRLILKDISKARPNSPFRVAHQDSEYLVVAKDAKSGTDYHFYMSREENISSPVFKSDGSPVLNKDTTPATATNAAERVQKRGEPLTKTEELTINLAIRDLNDYGIVWTDHKSANLDVVPDNTASTGYRVVFFDFDGFRPVKGPTRLDRVKAAREIQKAFDNPALERKDGVAVTEEAIELDPKIKTDRGWGDVNTRLMGVNKLFYPDELKRQEARGSVDQFLAFDYTAFSHVLVPTFATPPANMDRGQYLIFNAMSPDAFKKEVDAFNKAKGRHVEFKTVLPTATTDGSHDIDLSDKTKVKK